MSFPHVSVQYSNGNLLREIAAIDGIGGFLVTVDNPVLIGIPKVVFSLLDAETQGFTLMDEPFAHFHLAEFYKEVAGNQELWIMGTAETMTMAQALDNTNAEAGEKLVKAAEGKVRIVVVSRKPDAGYDGGIDFLDADVEAAVNAGLTFCQAQLTALRPVRILIEGRISNEDSLTIFQPAAAAVGFVGVVLGSSVPGTVQSVGVALGRAVKYAAHIKIGKVANGPLSIADAFIGTKNIKVLPNLEALHDMGFISFMKHPQKGGIYFGIDHMCSTDDFRLFAYGRVVDKAAIVAIATYTDEIENEVDVDPVTGFIAELDIKHLEERIGQQVKAVMGDQISGFEAVINPNQNIINTSTLTVQLQVIPKGYTSFIIVVLGLKAPTV